MFYYSVGEQYLILPLILVEKPIIIRFSIHTRFIAQPYFSPSNRIFQTAFLHYSGIYILVIWKIGFELKKAA